MEFASSFHKRLDDAFETLVNPAYRVEFDEEVIWSPFADIIADLEERQSAKRKENLDLRSVSRLNQICSKIKLLPMPGSTADKPIFIEEIENMVEILPTKTKPKKLAFRGSDGSR